MTNNDTKLRASDSSYQTCVIVGGGIGGMAAAAALSPYFNRITLLERDDLSLDVHLRSGLPQAVHVHSLLGAGREMLEKFFPGISEDLVRAGAHKLRAGIDQQIHEYGKWMPERDLGVDLWSQSRPTFERCVRARTASISNLDVLDRTKAKSLLLDSEDRVCGVDVTNAAGESVTLDCDMLVDASGLGGPFVKSLAEREPSLVSDCEFLESKIVYATAVLEKPEAFAGTKENVLIIAAPDQMRGGALADIEGNRWVVSLHGRNGLKPPTDIEAWKSFAKSLPSTRIWERIAEAPVVGRVHLFNKPISYLRRFDKLERLPQGYFPLGDTVNSINPTFGQGMTIALGHAKLLGECLAEDQEPRAVQAEFITRATAWSQSAWRRTLVYDSMFQVDDAAQKKKMDLVSRLALAKQAKAHADPTVHMQMFLEAQMLK